MAKRQSRKDRSSAAAAADVEPWAFATSGIVAALLAILVHVLDEEIADLVGAAHRSSVDRMAQAIGLGAVALGLFALWRREAEFLCGAAIVLGIVALFFEFFLFVAFVAVLGAVCVALYRTFLRR